MSRKRKGIAGAIVGAIFGGAFSIAMVKIADLTGTGPRFPVFAGEDDFDLRFKLFVGIAFFGFALLGGWLGWSSSQGSRSWPRGAIGATFATAIVGVAGTLLSPTLEKHFATSAEANTGEALFLIVWVLLGSLGAILRSRHAS